MYEHLVINFVVRVREVDGRFARSGETRHDFGCFVTLNKFCKKVSIYENKHKLKYLYLFIWLVSTMFMYPFITIMGILMGHSIRCEHAIMPFNQTLITVWPILSLYGLVFSVYATLSYFMTMVTVGWMIFLYTHYYKYPTLYFRR